MALRSMTGYGEGNARCQGASVAAQLSSVNRKTLEIKINMPPDMRYLESDVQSQITESTARGSIYCTIAIEWTRQARANAIHINRPLAKQYVARLREVGCELDLSGELPTEILLELPGVVEFDAPQIAPEEVRGAVSRAVATALKRMNAMRRREGVQLQKALAAIMEDLRRMAVEIRARVPEASENHRAKLENMIADAGLSGADIEERMLREILIYADKADITEELTRLESHFGQAREFMRSKKPAGRSLEFLTQEMLREINTISAKSADPKIAGLAISFKVELEKIREQIRNVE